MGTVFVQYKRILMVVFLGLILVAGCGYLFETIDQPDTADPNSSFEVPITVQVQDTGYVTPLFGILLPEGWWVEDSISCSGVYGGFFSYSSEHSDSMEAVDSAPVGYYWWVGAGSYADTILAGMCSFTPRIYTDAQTGTFFIDYMLGHDGAVNFHRSDNHAISVGVPMTVTVTNTNDSGAGSLRQAMVDVSCGGEITFDLTYPATITLDSQLVIDRNLTISGPTSGVLTISGNNAVRVFKINPNLSVSMSNLAISDGSAGDGDGGGIFIDTPQPLSGTLTLTSVTISGNAAVHGGGIHCGYNLNLVLTDVAISGNTATYGGGISSYNLSLTLMNAIISGNTAAHGGGIYCGNNPTLALTNVTISGNTAGLGGGIYCARYSSPYLTNVTFSKNLADRGGGFWCYSSSPALTNVTMSGNAATLSGGAIYSEMSSMDLVNCVVWGDVPQGIDTVGSSTTITYSDIQGGWAGTGNIDSDPLFADTANSDFSLTQDSPCIDAGTPDTTGLSLPPWDILGNQRIWDGDGDLVARVDMGAYEYGAPAVGIEDEVVVESKNRTSLRSYPNPLGSHTTIQYGLPGDGRASLKVYNLLGQEIRVLVDEGENAGTHTMIWDGRDDAGKRVPSGTYFLRLEAHRGLGTHTGLAAGDYTATKKLSVIR